MTTSIVVHIAALGAPLANWRIEHRHHCGGFARRTSELDRFIADFRERHGLELDHVYVGKMLLAVFAMVASGAIPGGSTVVAVVTGAPAPS